MRITKDKPDDSRNLREQAEKRAKQQIVEFKKPRGQDTAELVHELRVHQIELEIQNEELRNTQLELAESRNKYCELYDFAPVGYFTLNKEGLIVGANLTGATFLGEERGNLLKSKLSHFIAPGSQDEFYLHCKQVVESRTMQSCEVKLRRKDGTEFPAQLVSVAVAEQKSEYDQFHITIIDITERIRAEEEILWKTALLESQVEATIDGVLVVDGNNQKILTNKRLNEMWKIPQDIVESKDDTAQVKYAASQTKYPDQFLENVKYLYSHKDETTRDEVELKDGAVFDRYSSPVIDKNGKYLGRIWTFRDITDRKQAEEKLRQASTYNRSLIEASPDPLVTIGSDGKITDVNIATEAVTGYTRTVLVGTDFSDYFTEPKRAQAGYQQVFKKGVVHDYPLEIRHRDGHVTPVLYNASVYRNKAGEVVGVFAAARDITKRKRAEEKLQEERNLLRTLIDHIPDGIYIKDKEGRILGYNKSLAESWEAKGEDDIIGKTDFDLFEPEVAQHYFDEEQKIMQTGQPIINKEAECTDKSGNANFLLVTKVLLQDSAGNVTGLVGIHQDITERKQAERKILEYQKHLKQLAARLVLAEERERRRIAGEIHDEISQTLAIVNIKLDTLRNSPPFKASAAEIEEISSSVEKVIQETRTLTFELSNPLLYELGLEAAVAEWLSEQVQEKHSIATEFQDDGKAKLLDDDVKIMLFRNTRELLINCIKHANAGRVRVGIRRTNGSIEVVVEDNGVGFDPADVRLTAGKRVKFGLFSVRESLENSGGHFIIESKPGAGCKAIITAPLKDQSNKKET